MQQRTIILFITLFIAIVAGMFMFAYLKRIETTVPAVTPSVPEEEATTTKPYISRVDAKHYFIGGVHTLAGSIDMPTPCDLLQAEAVVLESFPEQIQVNFTVINNDDTCAQVITPQRFKVSATASKDATITASWKGTPIEINLIPAAPGEVPEDFELFIKG